MSKDKENTPKYSKGYHISSEKDIQEKIKNLKQEISKLLEESIENFPFKPDELVAIMDSEQRKFKYFAYIKSIEKDLYQTKFYIKYQCQTKTGKREKNIKILFADEFIVPADEVDTNDKYISPSLNLDAKFKF